MKAGLYDTFKRYPQIISLVACVQENKDETVDVKAEAIGLGNHFVLPYSGI